MASFRRDVIHDLPLLAVPIVVRDGQFLFEDIICYHRVSSADSIVKVGFLVLTYIRIIGRNQIEIGIVFLSQVDFRISAITGLYGYHRPKSGHFPNIVDNRAGTGKRVHASGSGSRN